MPNVWVCGEWARVMPAVAYRGGIAKSGHPRPPTARRRENVDVKKPSIKVAALAAIVVFGLAGCGSGSDGTSPSASDGSIVGSAEDAARLASITWTTDDAGVPLLVFDAPLSLAEGASRLIKEGDGAEIAESDLVSFHYTIASGADGSVVASSYADGLGPQSLILNELELDPAFFSAFVGRKVGAEIIYANLTTDPSGLTADLVPIFVAITVTDASTPLARAEGTPVDAVEGLPVITLAESGEPSVVVPAEEPPAELVAQTLVEGTGSPVGEGRLVVVHYSGWLWDGTPFDSSWTLGEPASFILSTGQLIDGWVQGLVGVPIGSQVLLVIPPSLGYGDVDQGSIPANSTLVFVIDVLAAV